MSYIDAETSKLSSNTIMALDLGGNLGWAMWSDGTVTSGSINLSRRNSKHFESPGMKFVRFSRWLKSIPTVDMVGFEEVRRHLGVDAAHAYGGYLSHLTAFCDTQTPPIPYEGISVGTIKKRATGNGSASKEMMIDACKEQLGITPTDDNEADAAWLLLIMVEAEGLTWPGGCVAPPVTTKKRSSKKQ